uniref:Peptidase S1 domain-containing protein n=1 Tax=Peronospora matthiolae TaxID=2874970 RepID=A0AAV1UMX2_9STRA
MKLAQILAFAWPTVSFVTDGYEFSSTRTSDTVASTPVKNSVNEENSIYGGSEADIQDYPFVSSLRFEAKDKTFCGGSLIDAQYIVTAGHCVKKKGGTVIAHLGTALGAGPTSGEEKIKVVAEFRHPMYVEKTHLYDVGLMKLERPSKHKPVKLCAVDGSDNEVGTEGTVLGWGKTENGSVSKTLQRVNLGVISNAECNKLYNNRITESMMCAGNGGGKDSCNGDSGGPLVTKNGTLIGFVSWGGKCGVSAGVFMRLTSVMEFINGVLSGNMDSTSLSRSLEEPTSSTLTTVESADTPTGGSSVASVAFATSSRCKVRRGRRRLSDFEEKVKEDVKAARLAKKAAEKLEADADKALEEGVAGSDEEEVEDAKQVKAVAKEEEKRAKKVIALDKELEEDLEEEEVEEEIEKLEKGEDEDKEEAESSKKSKASTAEVKVENDVKAARLAKKEAEMLEAAADNALKEGVAGSDEGEVQDAVVVMAAAKKQEKKAKQMIAADKELEEELEEEEAEEEIEHLVKKEEDEEETKAAKKSTTSSKETMSDDESDADDKVEASSKTSTKSLTKAKSEAQEDDDDWEEEEEEEEATAAPKTIKKAAKESESEEEEEEEDEEDEEDVTLAPTKKAAKPETKKKQDEEEEETESGEDSEEDVADPVE